METTLDKPSEDARFATPSIDRAEALRIIADARRLYDVADLVQARRVVGGIDSAVLAYRSFSLLLSLLVRLHGESVPDSFSRLLERARIIVSAESLMAEDLSPALVVIGEMRQRFLEPGRETTPADDRHYDRAFIQSGEWFAAVQTYIDQKLPPPESRLRRRVTLVFGAVLTFFVGFAVGKHVRSEPSVVIHTVPPPASVTLTGPAFVGTFYGDQTFGQQVFTRRDASISFNWEAEAPADSLPRDHFSVRWEGTLNIGEPGKYTFYLTSDDGSRLYVDSAVSVDNWGGHAPVTRTGIIELAKGPHPIRVDFYDEIGAALVRLEWSGERFERRLIAQPDLR